MNDVDPTSAYQPWRRDRPHHQAAALVLLVILVCVRYPESLLAPEPLGDEAAYVTAAERVVLGQSPFHGLYLYPPALAFAGAAVVRLASSDALMLLFRTFNVFGVVLLVWWSVALMPASSHRQKAHGTFLWRLAAAALYLAISPAVAYGLSWGNISLGIAAMIFLGLLMWPDRPVLAGTLLGSSIAIKPVAPIAVLALAMHRRAASTEASSAEVDGARPTSPSAHLQAVAIASTLAAILLLVPPYLRDFLSLAGQVPPYTRNIAFYRALVCFGVEPPTLVLFATVAILTSLFVRRTPRDPGAVLVIAIPATLLALPVVWSHTLLLTLPLQVMAAAHAGRALRDSRGADDRSLRVLQAVLVLGAILAIQLGDGVGGIDNQTSWLQGLVILLPALAPSALSAYLLSSPRRRPTTVASAA